MGDFTKETVYGKDAVAVAKRWESDGATFLHIVDLDGARQGKPVNFDLISSIMKNVCIPVEVGGGIREKETIKRFLELGVKLVILGTKACNSPEFMREVSNEFGESIAVSVDSTEGKVAIEGWEKPGRKNTLELIREVEKCGIRSIILTDIRRDGVLAGIDIEGIRQSLASITVAVTIAGGVSSLEDIQELKRIKDSKIRGVIIGRALYTGAIQLSQAIEVAEDV